MSDTPDTGHDCELPWQSLGFVRVAVVSPELRVADVPHNAERIRAAAADLSSQGVQIAVFPELCLTGYSCADLFYQRELLCAAVGGLRDLAATSALAEMVCIVGLPLEVDCRLYNVAAVLASGRIAGVVPKTCLPNRGEFYERRWFTSGRELTAGTVSLIGSEAPIGRDLLFQVGDLAGLTFGVEICEDLWSVTPGSGDMALAGATLIANLSASDEVLGKADYRRDLVRQQSARCLAAYAYAAAGPGESTTDVVYSGHSMIAENGVLLTESARFIESTLACIADIDVDRLRHERLCNTSFGDAPPGRCFRRVDVAAGPARSGGTLRRPPLSRTPFVPADAARQEAHCREIFSIQSSALAKRLRHTGMRRVTIGVSGGLDSTLALLVCARAFDRLGIDRNGILAVTMPGFGTTRRTRNNAVRLARMLGAELRSVPIGGAVRRHFADIGHDESRHDVTYENAQARERTQVLMDLANEVGGLCVGTGDLSELALGWCTFNGDHMSMYHVNCGVPKTLVRYLIRWCADSEFAGPAARVLLDICETPITPELLPRGAGGELLQRTEDAIGPYELHDFFLYQVVRHGFPPRKVLALAIEAFRGEHDSAVIRRWLEVFYRRFFANQFKRSAMPDGPKVGSVALSPRGDWRMPSDGRPDVWLQALSAAAAEFGCADG